MLSENLPNEEYEYSQLQYMIYDKYIPEIARIRKTNDKVFITVDVDMNYVSHRIVPFIEYGKEVEPTTTIEIKPHSSLFKPKSKQRKVKDLNAPIEAKPNKFAKLTDYEKKVIANEYALGSSFAKMANLLNLSFQKVRSYAYTQLKEVVEPKLNQEQQSEILALMQKGVSLSQISRELEYSLQLVKEFMKANALPKPQRRFKRPSNKEALKKNRADNTKVIIGRINEPSPKIKNEIDRFGLSYKQRLDIQAMINRCSYPVRISKVLGIEIGTVKAYLKTVQKPL
jgi:DNA-binding CsgD family transcriptional regulator